MLAHGQAPPPELETKLRDLFRLRGLGEIADLKPLATGYESDIYAFLYHPPTGEAQEMILRLYAGANTHAKCEHEFAVMQRLASCGYPVPSVLLCESTASPFDRPLIVMEKIAGRSLAGSFWAPFDERPPENIALFYELMARLHAIDPGDVLPRPETGFEPIPDELATLYGMWLELGSPAARAIFDSFESMSVRFWPVSLVHGDFHGNNVLLTPEGRAVVIDWSNLRLGDPRMDLAWARLLLRAREFPDQGAGDIALYESFSGRAVTDIDFFDVLASLRLMLSVMCSLRFGAESQGMRAGGEEVMRANRGLVDYAVNLLEEITRADLADLRSELDESYGSGRD